MNSPASNAPTYTQANGYKYSDRAISRQSYLQILKTALETKQYRFARESALNWLALYPGDLDVSCYYAQSMIGEGFVRQAIPILEGLCLADPEFGEALRSLWYVRQSKNGKSNPHPDTKPSNHVLERFAIEDRLYCDWMVALNDPTLTIPSFQDKNQQNSSTHWAQYTRLARQDVKDNKYPKAQQSILQAIAEDPATPLVAVTHLLILDHLTQMPAPARLKLADLYHHRWPICLPIMLYHAAWLIESGDADQGVAMIHQVVARDISGKVASRIWGQDHPYKSLWPDNLQLELRSPLPVDVAFALGLNRLPGAQTIDTGTQSHNAGVVCAAGIVGGGDSPFKDVDLPETTGERVHKTDNNGKKPSETLLSVISELENVGVRLNRSGISKVDGRFPVYVILSQYKKLQKKYGAQNAAQINHELQGLANAIQHNPVAGTKRFWGSRIFLVDQQECTTPLGVQPILNSDPWQIKLALTDLEKNLAGRGEMIGALLIVGGPDIVPFHLLPNPVDDPDEVVPSDNPYASRDENYFIPEWPVSRLPDGAGNDPTFLIEQIRKIILAHSKKSKRASWTINWMSWLISWLRGFFNTKQVSSLGYTAAIWKSASQAVYRPIGDPHAILVSPPMGINEKETKPTQRITLPAARLGYFNLHGLAESSEWYGQRDPLDQNEGVDYPVALRTEDIVASASIPTIVFSEACYGLHIQEKRFEDAMSLKLLESGSQAVAGSTCMSYGSISEPLIAADLLGYSFWYHLKNGLPAGEALRRAKIHLASEMHQRQGYLDGEDQKTLISFILFGDPLAMHPDDQISPKSVYRLAKPPAEVRTICDRTSGNGSSNAIPRELTDQVRELVARYLPGMSDAAITFASERNQCNAIGHTCPTSQIHSKTSNPKMANRKVITLSKKVQKASGVHPQIARITINSEGKLVKLVVSR